MSNLDQQTFRDIVNLLIPHCADSASRKSLVDTALFGCQILNQIDWTGSARDFTAHLVRQLLTYGECETDKPAMVMILSQLREHVGILQQSQVDALIARLPLEAPVPPDIDWQIPDLMTGKYVFISYSRNNLDMVRQITTDLLNAGVNMWIDQVGLKPGTVDWEQALRDALHHAEAVLYMASPTARRSPYVRDELAIADMEQVQVYPIWIEGEQWMDCVPMGRGYVQFIDIRDTAYMEGIQQVIEMLSNNAGQPPLAEAEILPRKIISDDKPPRNPYKGLRAFRAEDEADFFGRDALIEELIEALGSGTKAPRLLAVLGASGSGKSSVVMAGLLPQLQKGAIKGSENWLYFDPIVPGTHPIESLTIALRQHMKATSQTAIHEDLMNPNKRGLHTLPRELSKKPVVLYIDQFEELFTLTNDESERRQFIDLLTTAVTEPHGVLFVVLSMRADFYDRPMQYPEFGGLIENQHIVVKPMSLADLYDVVKKPAQLPDVHLEMVHGLGTALVFAVREEAAGALPLLQFTLDQLFEKREGRTLTLEAYRALGGVQGALAQHAEATFNGLPSGEHRNLAHALLLRLIEPGTTEQDTTRRRATVSELTLADAQQTQILQETASIFVDARLLVSDKSGDERTIEVSHEALIREWKRLGEWLHEARDDLRLQKSLSGDVAEWKRREQPTDMLYRGTVLQDAQAWAYRNIPSQDETLFLQTSVNAEVERKKHDEIIARRVQNFQRASIVLLIVAGIAAMFTVVAGAAFVGATNQVGTATVERGQAQASATQLALDVTVFAVQNVRNATLAAGAVVVPLKTITPDYETLMADLTQIAVWNAWQPVEMLDDFDVVMVEVPAGCFYMGSVSAADEQPIHQQCFEESFWIDMFEVTNAQYEAVLGEPAPSMFSAPYNPVDNITWFGARDFCLARDARLPTEAEWEYAARGPDSVTYPWGNDFVPENVVYNRRTTDGTLPVMDRSGRALREDGQSWVGAFDMAGNVLEWTSTIYDYIDLTEGRVFHGRFPYPYQDDEREADESVQDFRERLRQDDVMTLRVLRGGAFADFSDDVRSAFRYGYNPEYVLFQNGLRCARSEK